MIWKTPHFWWKPSQKRYQRLLRPLAALFTLGAWLRRKMTRPLRAPFPVLSVGNLVMGGAGKTPTVLALAKYLQQKGKNPFIVLRGFGGAFQEPTAVDPRFHTVEQVGDEALLFASTYPTCIARQRKKILPLLAGSPDSTVILLDDAHQHTSLLKDLSLLVVDGRQQFGNGSLFPAGPLRESLKTGLKRADALILIGETEPDFLESLKEQSPQIPLLRAHLKPLTSLPVGLCVMGFAGLGYPHKFLKTLQEMELNVMEFQSFPDHYPYREEDMLLLREKAASYGATLVTTAKDFVRVPEAFRAHITVVEVELIFDHPAELEAFFVDKKEFFRKNKMGDQVGVYKL